MQSSDLSPHHLSPLEGTPAKAFKCPLCGRTFTRRDVMLRHQKRVTCKLNSYVRYVGPPSSHTAKPPRDTDGTATLIHPRANLPRSNSAPNILPRSASIDHKSIPVRPFSSPTALTPSRRGMTTRTVGIGNTTDITTTTAPHQPSPPSHSHSLPAPHAATSHLSTSIARRQSLLPLPSHHTNAHLPFSNSLPALPSFATLDPSPAFLEPRSVSVHPDTPAFPMLVGL